MIIARAAHTFVKTSLDTFANRNINECFVFHIAEMILISGRWVLLHHPLAVRRHQRQTLSAQLEEVRQDPANKF